MIGLAFLLSLQTSPDTGAVLYQAWCKNCHGVTGQGTPSSMTRLEGTPANLASCPTSTAETEDQWVGIVTHGGSAYGLSIDMPAFGDGATPEQIRAVVKYVRSLCGQAGWPPGELNFPRAFLVEKAFPENEVVVVNEGRSQEFIFEHRLGKRLQFELNLRSVLDSVGRPFGGGGGAVKYNVWHSLKHRALASLGIEAALPVGRLDIWEVEPFLTLGIEPVERLYVQGQVVAAFEQGEGLAAWSYRLGLGREVGRLVPMLEAGWDVPTEGAPSTLTVYPHLWVRLSRLGHIAASFGAALPATGPWDPKLIGFILWDFGDAPLLHGW